MSMGGSVRLRRNAVRLVSDHCPACVGLLSGTDRKTLSAFPEMRTRRVKLQRLEAEIMYVRRANKRGDARHPAHALRKDR